MTSPHDGFTRRAGVVNFNHDYLVGVRVLGRSGGKFSFTAALAVVLSLASVPPVAAQFFNIFNPDGTDRVSSDTESSRAVRTHRRYHHDYNREARHRRSHRESDRESRREAKRHKHEAERARAPRVGPYTIVVAIGPQEALLYGKEGLIDRASISTGMPGHPTPMGVFTVISKARWHASNIYSGAPMPFMQRITWSGVALHAGPRPGYPASHGCIRLPEDFAIRLYHTTKIGARVIVTREAVAPTAIDNPKLFVPKVAEAKPVTVAANNAIQAVTLAAKTSTNSATAQPLAVRPAATAADGTRLQPTAAPAVATTPAATGTVTLPTEEQPPAAQPQATPPPHPGEPISVFISRKQGKGFVRQGFTELFDMPATIADPARAIGTHVYTAMALDDGGKAMRWTVVSIPSEFRRHHREVRRRHGHKILEEEADATPAATAAEALNRITLPPEAIAQIDAMLVPGSSLIVSDNALSDETDDSTDFIVLTP